jgi:hypothetical protein
MKKRKAVTGEGNAPREFTPAEQHARRLRDKENEKAAEKKLVVRLVDRLVDIGYKKLVIELGHSERTMARLNVVRENLKEAAREWQP